MNMDESRLYVMETQLEDQKIALWSAISSNRYRYCLGGKIKHLRDSRNYCATKVLLIGENWDERLFATYRPQDDHIERIIR